MAERVRTTISVDSEVLDVFRGMAEAAGISVSRCMGDWLGDTVDGAQFVSQKMQEARKAPATVMREMQSMAHGLHAEMDAVMGMVRERSKVAGGGLPTRPTRPAAPPSNTGLNSPGKAKGRR